MRWLRSGRRRRHCPHSRLQGIYGDEINAVGGWRLYCVDCCGPGPHAGASIERHRFDTGPSPAVKAIVLVRSKGRCEVCGNYLDGPHSYHHRQPRQMGGSGHCDWINLPSNLLLVCGSATSPDGCHQLIESQRALAYANGWLVHRPERPAEIPVELHHGLRYLDDDGNHAEGSP